MEERTDLAAQKKILRQNILALRNQIPETDRKRYHARIHAAVMATPAYRRAQIILAYASYLSEVDTTALLRRALADGKYVFVPKVSGAEMDFWRITAPEDLQEGYKGIPEPAAQVSLTEWLDAQPRGRGAQESICSAESIARTKTPAVVDDDHMTWHMMMWMPGVVFDRARHRIGYGKGFYDRYLSRFAYWQEEMQRVYDTQLCLTTAALAYSCQVLTQIPHEPHDIRPELLITEDGVLR